MKYRCRFCLLIGAFIDNVAQAGTFIALHDFLQLLSDNQGMLDVFDTGYNLRKQQAYMVDSTVFLPVTAKSANSS